MERLLYYATSYSLQAKELYIGFDSRKLLKTDPKLLATASGTGLHDLYGKILRYFFYLIILDIIENKIVFKFPKTCKAYLEMVPVSGKNFEIARQNGAFLDIDFLVSNFTGYQLNLRISNRYGARYKRIHVSKKYKDRITELTNSGHGW